MVSNLRPRIGLPSDAWAILIEVLERDGHDVSDYERELAKQRSGLATRLARQFRLLEVALADERPETAASTQG